MTDRSRTGERVPTISRRPKSRRRLRPCAWRKSNSRKRGAPTGVSVARPSNDCGGPRDVGRRSCQLHAQGSPTAARPERHRRHAGRLLPGTIVPAITPGLYDSPPYRDKRVLSMARDVEFIRQRRVLRLRIARLRRRLDGRVHGLASQGRRLTSWRTYVARFPGYAALAAVGLGLAVSVGLRPPRLDAMARHHVDPAGRTRLLERPFGGVEASLGRSGSPRAKT